MQREHRELLELEAYRLPRLKKIWNESKDKASRGTDETALRCRKERGDTFGGNQEGRTSIELAQQFDIGIKKYGRQQAWKPLL